MLSRKGSCAGMMSAAAAGVDRSRVGERLQAALAGLQELHLLRDKQSEMVSRALRVDQDEPVTRVPAAPATLNALGTEEQRLEATLTALKQQLVGKRFYPKPGAYVYFNVSVCLCVFSEYVNFFMRLFALVSDLPSN